MNSGLMYFLQMRVKSVFSHWLWQHGWPKKKENKIYLYSQ